MEILHVPDEMINQLHAANRRFGDEKCKLEEALNGGQYRYQERVDTATTKLREAERSVEEIEGRIRDLLKHPS